MRTMQALLLLGIPLILAGCNRKTAVEAIIVGHIAPLSGPDGWMGQHGRQGILLAIEEANREENRPGGRPIEVLHADSDGEQTGQASAVRLVKINKALALLTGLDAVQSDTVAGVAQTSGVSLVAGAGVPGSSVRDFVFYVGPTPVWQARCLARFAAQELKVKRIALLVDAMENRGSVGITLAAARAAAFEREFGHTIAANWHFKNPGELKEYISRLESVGAEALVVAGVAADVVEASQSRLAKKLPILLAGPESAVNELQTAGLYNPVYYSSAFADDRSFPQNKDFLDKYQQRFGQPADVYAALAFDAAKFLVEGLRQATLLDRAGIHNALDQIQTLDSLTGRVAIARDHWAARAIFIVRLENGAIHIARRYDPDGTVQTRATSLALPLAALYAAFGHQDACHGSYR